MNFNIYLIFTLIFCILGADLNFFGGFMSANNCINQFVKTDSDNPVAMAQWLCQDYSTCCTAMITGFALFVIACMAAAGTFPGATAGWVAVGIGAGGFVLNLISGNLKERKWEIITTALATALLVTIGALGGTGVIAAHHVGGAILGATFGGGIIRGLGTVPDLLQARRDAEKLQAQFQSMQNRRY